MSSQRPKDNCGEPIGEELLGMAADWYWETDAEHRLSQIQPISSAHCDLFTPATHLGRPLWQLGTVVQIQDRPEDLRDLMGSSQKMRDITLRLAPEDPEQRPSYVRFSGLPGYDDKGRFTGYRGLGTLVSDFWNEFEQLTRFRTAMDRSGDAIYLTDAQTMKFVDVNTTACERMGYTRAELLTRGPADLLAIEPDVVRRDFEEVINSGAGGIRTESVAVTKDGNETIAEMHRRPIRLGNHWVIISVARDITRRKRAELSAQRMSRMYAALSATEEAILWCDSADEIYQKVCDAAIEGGKFLTTVIFTKDAKTDSLQVVAGSGAGIETLKSSTIDINDTKEAGRGLLGTACRTGKPCISNDYPRDPATTAWHPFAGRIGLASAAAVPVFRDKKLVGASLFYSEEKDMFDDEVILLLERMMQSMVYALDRFDLEAEKSRSHEHMQHMATHDALTGLPNRIMFNELLQAAVESGSRYQRKFALMFVDLDRFKDINDTLGHDTGDIVLKEIASRFRGCLRASDIIARLGGDEFVALLQEVAGVQQCTTVAQNLLAAATRPVEALGNHCNVSASIGIAVFPDDGSDESSLMKNADLAMYQAKEQGKNAFLFYSDELNKRSIERLVLESELRKAIDNDELTLHYQAKINTGTGKLTGVEALLRCESPVLGNLQPGQILPVAEETGLVIPIGRWVLKTACEQNVTWRREGLPPLCIAVNLSARQFFEPTLVDDVANTLKATGLLPHLLELEITEGVIMADTERSIDVLKELNDIGVRITVEDFGSYFAAMSQIKRFPVDTLKVNQSFIHNIPFDEDDRDVVKAIISLGKSLCPNLVVMGVETEAQKVFLSANECREIQGYLVNKPVPADEFLVFLKQQLGPEIMA